MEPATRELERSKRWRSRLAVTTGGLLCFLALTGLVILFVPFSVTAQVTVLVHTLAGLAIVAPGVWYLVRHWGHYRKNSLSHVVVSGYLAAAALLVCVVSGLVLTWQAAFATRIGYWWDTAHTVTTFAILGFALPHVLWIAVRDRKRDSSPCRAAAAHYGKRSLAITAACFVCIAAGVAAYRRPALQEQLPADYV